MFKKLFTLLILSLVLSSSVFAETKNIIVFIGDGMGISTLTAARKLNQELNQKDNLSFEKFPYTALVDVKCNDYLVPDSACTATAIATGVSANSGVLGLDNLVRRGSFANFKQANTKSLLSYAKERSRLTGLITTTAITDATPAGFYSHSPERAWQSDAEMPEALRAKGFSDIAKQLIDFSSGDGLDLVLGGGRQRFLSNSQVDPEYPNIQGLRLDGVDLIKSWTEKSLDSKYVWNKADLLATDFNKTKKLLGLFEPGHMAYEGERNKQTDPSLSEMVASGLDFLYQKSSNGFFLMVEGGRIDHAHHENLAKNALEETIQLGEAVEVALSKVDLSNTLILVTADHSHTLGIVGYPKNSESILGQGHDPESYPAKYSFLNYLSGPGARYAGNKQSIPSNDKHYHQNSLINSASAKHGGEDVALFAIGAGSENFHGAIKQRQIFQLIKDAAKF